MNKLNLSSQVNPLRHLSNIEPIKNSLKSYSPSNIKHRNHEKFKNQQKKILGSFKRIHNKKNSSNTPSPLLRRDKSQGSKDKKQDKSVSRYNNNSKKQFESCRLPKNRQHTQSLMEQTSTLRAQMLNLKSLYEVVLKQKSDIQEEQKKKGEELRKVVNELQKYKKSAQKYKNRLICTEHELQRIKKQCFKLLEIQTFKNKKLQQTLQEKELMIYYLRNQLGKENLGTNHQHNIFLQSTTPIFKNQQEYHQRNQSKAYCSVNSMESGVISSQQKSKIVLSVSSYDQDKIKHNLSQISQHQLSLSKDKHQQMSQILQSFILSPNPQSKLTKQQFKKYLLKEKSSQTYTQQSLAEPNYHTFQLKQQQKQVKVQQKAFKKSKKNAEQNQFCEEKYQISIEMKKKSRAIKSKRKSKKHLDDKQSSSRSIDKKLGRFQFNLPGTKEKKSKNSYR